MQMPFSRQEKPHLTEFDENTYRKSALGALKEPIKGKRLEPVGQRAVSGRTIAQA
jgi:hypothetical protein